MLSWGVVFVAVVAMVCPGPVRDIAPPSETCLAADVAESPYGVAFEFTHHVGNPTRPFQAQPHRRGTTTVTAAGERSKAARGRPRSDSRNLQLGSRLRQFRRARRLSQLELGERVGVTSQQVHRYENGKSAISALTLWQLARALDVAMEDFFAEMQPDHLDGAIAGG